MSRLRRRHFLQLAGAALGTIGINQIDFLRQGNRMHRVLAQPTGRKLALLVGVNNYPGALSELSGCLNDVRLQYELLVNRYGFDPQNIAIVSDATLDLPAREQIAPPTRQAIVDAFRTHLIDRAQPGDTVVFHYSGHGTYVQDPHPVRYPPTQDYSGVPAFENFEGKNGAIVPMDVLDGVPEGEANVITGNTIFLLSHALKTDNVTLVLDSCYAGGGVRGNLIYRATVVGDDENPAKPSQTEQSFQEQLIEELGLTRDRVQQMRQDGIAKGVAMTSALATQVAAETSISGFKAGIFTYLLTRYLWQTASGRSRPLNEAFIDLARIASSQVDALGSQQNPIYFAKPGSNLDAQPPYLIKATAPAADAVVRSVQADGTVAFWLGGMTPSGLKDTESIFEVIDDRETVLGQIRQTSRNGLVGYGEPLEGLSVEPGMLMREYIRGIPEDTALRIGLHESLGDDLAVARQALETMDRVTPIEVNGETETDYLLGRFNESVRDELRQQGYGDRPDLQDIEVGSIGLFSNALDPIATTFRSKYEKIGAAMERLSPRLRLLLAKQVLKTIENTDNSDLKVNVQVSSNRRGGVGTLRSSALEEAKSQPQSRVVQMRTGEEMSLQVTNQEDRSLYAIAIAIERDGDMYVYHPSHWDAAEIDAELGPGESVTIPKPDDVFYMPIQGPPGYFELLVIASTEQLRDTLKSLQRLSNRSLRGGQVISFTRSEEASRTPQNRSINIVRDLLGDFSRNAQAPMAIRGQAVSTSQVATLGVTIEVVES
jgi:hypothetical protein